jgi:hypothetical protein
MRRLARLEYERKSGASRYVIFRQSPEAAHNPSWEILIIGRPGQNQHDI